MPSTSNTDIVKRSSLSQIRNGSQVSTSCVFSAENVHAHIRGGLVMCWQVWANPLSSRSPFLTRPLPDCIRRHHAIPAVPLTFPIFSCPITSLPPAPLPPHHSLPPSLSLPTLRRVRSLHKPLATCVHILINDRNPATFTLTFTHSVVIGLQIGSQPKSTNSSPAIRQALRYEPLNARS